MLWPWNGGASSLRRLRWSAPSSANTEPGPKILLRLGFTLGRSSVLARNTCRSSAGSETTTLRPKNGTLISKTAPKRLTPFRMAHRRKPANRTPRTGRGRRTAGGRFPAGVVDEDVDVEADVDDESGVSAAAAATSVMCGSLPPGSLVLRCTARLCSTVRLGTKQAQGLSEAI